MWRTCERGIAWKILWRLIASSILLVVAWLVIDLLARQVFASNPGYALATGTVARYFLAGAGLTVIIWGLMRVWQPLLNPPTRPGADP